MNEALETRIVFLEKLVAAQAKLNFILFPLILQHDIHFRDKALSVLRQILVSPDIAADPFLVQQIAALRDSLVAPIPQEIVEAVQQPSIRPVE